MRREQPHTQRRCRRAQSNLQLRTAASSSVAAVALLAPWIAVDVIAVHFPEAGSVFGHKPKPAYPLRTLPEVEVWHQKTCRTTVLGFERRAIECERDPRFPTGEVLQRQVCCITAVGIRHCEFSRRLDASQQRIHRHALPLRAQLTPLGDAVNIAGDVLGRELSELIPTPG